MNYKWINFYVPVGGSLVIAYAAGVGINEAGSAGLGWGVGIAIAVIGLFTSQRVVGFLCGLIGYEPPEMAVNFAQGWYRGASIRKGSGQAPGNPLEMPRPDLIYLPDVLILKSDRWRSGVTGATSQALALLDSGQSFDGQADEVVRTLLPRFLNDPAQHMETLAPVMTHATRIGFAFAVTEQTLGWMRPKQTDKRIHTALVMAGTQTPNEMMELAPTIAFFQHAGYWVARTGPDGLVALMRALGNGKRATA